MSLNLYGMNPQIYDDYISTAIEKINFDKVFTIIEQLYEQKKKLKILDLCCGTGIFPRKWLIKLENITYKGVDINQNFIDFANTNLANNKFQFIVNDALTYNTNEKFDLIIATSSYHHIIDENKRKYLNNIYLHLQDDGYLLIYEKMVDKFNDRIEAVDCGTKFYLERIKYILKNENISDNQMFALFNELYLTAIRQDEYKVDFDYLLNDLDNCNLKLKEHFKLWPDTNVFNNEMVGDFVFIIQKTQLNE